MRRTLTALLSAALLISALVIPASAANDVGRAAANGAFRSVGTGLWITDVATAAQRTHISIPAADKKRRVAIFGYGGGPSQDQVFCGDVWNVIVTVATTLPEEKYLFDHLSATHRLNGNLVGANDRTAIRAIQSIEEVFGFDGRGWTRAFGTFLAPGTLNDGPNTVKQVLWFDQFPVWEPVPLMFEVNDSAC